MDPTTVIVTALTTGATYIAKQIGSDAVKDGYLALKELVKKRFEKNPQAEMALAESEADPETWEKPLAKAVQNAGLERDNEVVQAAQRVLTQADPEGAAKGKYNVVMNDTRGVVIGDHSKVYLDFRNEKPDN